MKKYNIYHRKDGRWEGRILKNKCSNGKRSYYYVFARSKSEVIKKLDNLTHEQKHSTCCKTFAVVFNEWSDNIRYKIKESTLSNYMMKADKHIFPYFGIKRIDIITTEDVLSFMQLKLSQGLSVRYVNDIIILIKTVYKYAVKEYNVNNPVAEISLRKNKKTEINLLDESEQIKLQEFISVNHNLSTLGTALSMSTGIRIGELCALQWKDIDFDKRILTVKKTMQRIQCNNNTSRTKLIISDPKSESSKRRIPIPDCMMSFLIEFRKNDNDFILSAAEKPIEPRTMQYRFSKILKNANLPSVHFHALRHIFASSCVKLGFDIKSLSELLGHSSVEITLNRYVHSSFD